MISTSACLTPLHCVQMNAVRFLGGGGGGGGWGGGGGGDPALRSVTGGWGGVGISVT